MIIRYGFETNSSSSHSLVINPSVDMLNSINDLGVYEGANESQKFVISGNTRFGWEWEIWDSPADKLFYMLIDADDENFTSLMREYIASKVDVTPENVIFNEFDGRDSYDCYVDHESHGTSLSIRSKPLDEIWEFIMNPNSCVRGGNDNQCGPWSKSYAMDSENDSDERHKDNLIT